MFIPLTESPLQEVEREKGHQKYFLRFSQKHPASLSYFFSGSSSYFHSHACEIKYGINNFKIENTLKGNSSEKLHNFKIYVLKTSVISQLSYDMRFNYVYLPDYSRN